MTQVVADKLPSDDADGGQLSFERSRAASETGAAIAHQLNGPLTALLLYVSELCQNCDQFPVDEGKHPPLKQIAKNALREAEHVCSLIRRIGDVCIAPMPDRADAKYGREIIAWWSRTMAMEAGCPVEGASASEISDSSYLLLTQREREVLRLITEGRTSKEGAARLNIGPRTFESHRARILKKFKAKNTAELVRMALQTETVDESGKSRSPSDT